MDNNQFHISEGILNKFDENIYELYDATEEGRYAVIDGKQVLVDNSYKGTCLYLHHHPGYASWYIGEGENSLEIIIYTERGDIPEKALSLIKPTLKILHELDCIARSEPDDFDHKEELAYITIYENSVVLCYWATTVNTEWNVVFECIDGGLKLKSIGLSHDISNRRVLWK